MDLGPFCAQFFKVVLIVISFMIVLGVLRSAWFKGIAGEALDPKNDLPEIRGGVTAPIWEQFQNRYGRLSPSAIGECKTTRLFRGIEDRLNGIVRP